MTIPAKTTGPASSRVETPQIHVWKGDFGREYTDRNTFDLEALEAHYRRTYGVTRREMNDAFLGEIPSEASFLEVGCNSGNQLLLLQRMGYRDLSGVEVQPYALEIARSRTSGISLTQGSVLSLPYEAESFDVVFTSGVLIHIAPEDLPRALDEICRCARTYIWGIEYYAPDATAVNYRSHNELLWKMDYARRYLDLHPDLELVREQRFPYVENSNVDAMFLLKKNHAS